MTKPMVMVRLLLGLGLLVATSAQAAPLVYEGFEAVPGGSSTAYNSDGSIIGQGPVRTGFTGVWSQSGGLATGVIDFVARTDGLAYPGTTPGEDGRMELYRVPTSPSSGTKVATRGLSYTAPETDDFYLAFQLAYDGSFGGGRVSFTGSSRDFHFQLSNTGTLTVAPAGVQAMTHTTDPLAANTAHLVVVKVINDPANALGGNPNTAFYDYLEVWVNPEISPAGELPAPHATGYGIVRNQTGGAAVPFSGFQLAGDVRAGHYISADEVYITTNLADIIIPEPMTLGLVALGALGILARRRPRA